MELAAALHHSWDARSNVVHAALRGQKSSGTRPEPLEEVSNPQVGAVTVRHVAAPGPLLVVASLAGGDEVDATTVSFLLRENLKLQKKKEEEKERRRKREEAEYEAHMQELDRRVQADVPLTPAESRAWRKWAGHFPIPTRSKKKRKKKKLPRCARLDKVVDVPVIINDKFLLFLFQL